MQLRNTKLLKVGLMLAMAFIGLSLVFVALAVDTSDFTHRNNLSRTGKHNLQSGPPQMDRKGAAIAVVWSDGFNTQQDTGEAGHIYLAAADEGLGYWKAKRAVFSATLNNWAIDPDLTFDPDAVQDTVHVVWSEGLNCNGFIFNCRFRQIRYSSCNVSGNITTCAAPQTVADSGSASISYVNPSIAQDDDGDLHVVWTQEGGGNQLRYSRKEGGANWSSSPGAAIAGAGNGRDGQLLFSGGRLHLVWDADDNTIKHRYSNSDDGSDFTPTGNGSFTGNASPYANADPTNPTLTGLDDWLLVGFDVENPNSAGTFGLFYAMSGNNGSNWNQVFSIPDQGQITPMSSPGSDLGLKPSFAITTTGAVTRLHAVWHENVRTNPTGFPIFRYRVRFSDLSLTAPIVVAPNCTSNPGLCWSEPVTATHVLSPTGKDTTDANLVITQLAGGDGTGHVAFLQDLDDTPSDEDQIDVYYLGGIAGTIDPEYIVDEFVGPDPTNPNQFKKVTPTSIITSIYPIFVDLDYRIAFTNTGELVAVGVGITDTLPNNVTYNNDLTTGGNMGPSPAVYIAATRVISWYGNVDPGERVEILFSVKTGAANVPPTTMRNKLEMWNIGVEGHKPFITSYASTLYATSITYLPIIFK